MRALTTLLATLAIVLACCGGETSDAGPDVPDPNAPLDHTRELLKVVYEDGRFLAVGTDGESALIVESEDGSAWSQLLLGDAGALYDVVRGDTLWVAVGYQTMATSPDGVTWTQRGTPEGAWLESVVWDGATFWASGQDGLLRSADAETWEPVTIPERAGPRLTQGPAGLVLMGGGGARAYFSTDGTLWQEAVTPRPLEWAEWGEGRFVGAGYAPGDEGEIVDPVLMTSADGVTWVIEESLTPELLPRGFADAQGILVGAGPSTVISDVGEGVAERLGAGSSQGFNDAAYGDGVFVVVGFRALFYSGDAVGWTEGSWPE